MKELTLPASRTNIPAITEFVNRELERMDCDLKTMAQIDIAIDELYSNIAKYGFDDDGGEVTVTLETASEPRVVSISFMDGGRPFNPLERSDPDITLSARDRGAICSSWQGSKPSVENAPRLPAKTESS